MQRGYTTLLTDADVAWLHKPVWASFLALMRLSQADMALQLEQPSELVALLIQMRAVPPTACGHVLLGRHTAA